MVNPSLVSVNLGLFVDDDPCENWIFFFEKGAPASASKDAYGLLY
jgi:hypothetical protein